MIFPRRNSLSSMHPPATCTKKLSQETVQKYPERSCRGFNGGQTVSYQFNHFCSLRMKQKIFKEAKHQRWWDTEGLAVNIQQSREREWKRVKREDRVPGGPLDAVLRACDIWLDQCSSVRDSPLIHSSSRVNKHITYARTHTHTQ